MYTALSWNLMCVISLILIISSVHSKPHNIKAFDTNYSKIDVKNKLRDLKDRNESQRLFKKSITPPTDQTPLVADVDKKSQIILQNPGLKTLQQLYYGTLSYQGFINIQPAQAQQQQTFIPILSPQIIVAPFAIPPNANFNPFIDSAQTPSLIHNSSSESEATKPVSVLPSSVKPVTQTTENNYYSSISTTLKPPTYTTVHPVQYHPIVNQFGTSSTTTTLKPLTYNPNLNIFATGNYPPQTTRPYYLPPNHAVYNFDIRKHTISNVTNISTATPTNHNSNPNISMTASDLKQFSDTQQTIILPPLQPQTLQIPIVELQPPFIAYDYDDLGSRVGAIAVG